MPASFRILLPAAVVSTVMTATLLGAQGTAPSKAVSPSTKQNAHTPNRAKRAVAQKAVKLTGREITLYGLLLRMQDRRELDTALVRIALASRAPAVRAQVALAVTQVGPAHRAEAEALLNKLAADADTAVAANAAFGVKFLTYATRYNEVARDMSDTIASRRPLVSYDSIVRNIIVPTLAGHAPEVTVTTNRGAIRLQMLATQAPLTVANFLALVQKGFYTGIVFHRVEPGFVVQGGDPTGTGSGGAGYAIHDEFNRESYTRGAVGIATSGPDTGGSQYFLTLGPATMLDGKYTLFGRVVGGLDVMDTLQIGDKMVSVAVQ